MTNFLTVAVGQQVSDTIAAGQVVNYVVTLPAGKFYLVTTPPAKILCGIYGPQPIPSDPIAVGTLGLLRVEGVGSRGEHLFKSPGSYLLQITGEAAGAYGFTIELPSVPNVAGGFWSWLAKLIASFTAPKPAPPA